MDMLTPLGRLRALLLLQRMSRHYQLDVDVKKSPGANAVLKAGVALSDEERACADAIAFLTGAMTTLHRAS